MTVARKKTHHSRRGFLAALGSSALLPALASGIPAEILLRPLSARAGSGHAGRVLILSSDSGGGPINANVPGTYEAGPTEIFHPLAPSMAATSLTLGAQPWTAAKPWADLPQPVLDQTCFFHHATYTPVHGEHPRVMKMMGASAKGDMLVSHLAREVGSLLGTVQNDPISLGASGPELLSSAGRLLGNVAPTSVAQALGGVDGPLAELRPLRDQAVDRLYALYKERGTPAQRDLLDSWARSREDARSVSLSLLSRLDGITGDGEDMQIRTAAVLAAMKIAPVITVHLDFGGDNHTDVDLAIEAERYPTAVANIGLLMQELDALRNEGSLPHDIVFATLNVFGRTLKQQGYSGRDHHDGHHTMVMIGPGVAPGVVGGVAPNSDGSEYVSQGIDPITGAARPEGGIPFEETLGAAGKTLGRLVGVEPARLDELLPPGKIVQAALT